jgi:surface antigen
MKLSKIFTAVLLASSMMLTACANSPYNDGGIHKREVGTAIGGVGGALLGSQIGSGSGQLVATAAGALLGAGLGSSIGASLDRADLAYHDRAAEQALEYSPSGKPVQWVNPDSGNRGMVTVTNTYQRNNGEYCREYNDRVNIGGRTENVYGTACRQPDGSWEIVRN